MTHKLTTAAKINEKLGDKGFPVMEISWVATRGAVPPKMAKAML
jgi:hypothetical protein